VDSPGGNKALMSPGPVKGKHHCVSECSLCMEPKCSADHLASGEHRDDRSQGLFPPG
jgi:hypothetical protein